MAEPQDERYVFLEELLGSAQVPKLVMVDIRPNHRVAPALVALQDEGQRHDLIAMSQGMVIGTQVPIVLDVELADVVAKEAFDVLRCRFFLDRKSTRLNSSH